MPVSALAGLIFGVSALAIGCYHAIFVAPRLGKLDRLIVGAGGSAPGGDSIAARAATTAGLANVEARVAALERAHRRDVHRVGFVRYNSFDDVGSDLSFTLALLNEAGDGVVVTNIYSREETRTYGKSVRKFVPQQGASEEERSAIAMARTGVGV